MVNKISFPQVAGAALLTVIPLFSACSFKSTEEPTQPIKNSQVAEINAALVASVTPVQETMKLKLIARSVMGRSSSSIATDVVGITNCIETAKAFAETENIDGIEYIRAVCTPAEGGPPVARLTCSKRNDAISCTKLEHF